MFNKSLETSLNQAFSQAREKHHEFITVEHMLLALLDNAEVSMTLMACGANLDRLRAGLGIFIDETTPHIPLNVQRDIQPTLSFQRVLQRAIYQVQSSGSQEVTANHVLAAIFDEQDSQAIYFLNQENVSRIDILNFITQGISKNTKQLSEEEFNQEMNQPAGLSRETSTEDGLIETYAINLNERALAGRFNPLIGRALELERAIQILCRRSKNNPLFVGEAGVGKTAIAEGLAQMIVSGKVPSPLAYSVIYSLDLGMLLAGTKYRGDFEKRFKSVLKALSRHTGAIIFIDEIHNLVGAGSATGGTMDASNLIKPLLSSGELRCMGATTYEEYRNYFAKDHALLRRFQKVDITEPSVEQSFEILEGLKSRFENYHQVAYSTKALQRAVTLAARYMPDRHLPDKAIDIIDEAGAYQRLQPPTRQRKVIDEREIEAIIAKMTRVPIQHLNASDKQILKQLPNRLKRSVFGQDQAIDIICDAVKLSRSGLKSTQKPVGSFLLAGPTGVGKTEISKQLALELDIELIRFDMSEYMERHAISRLIGAPPGYVGYDQGGLLTEAILKHPYAVLLLDEIEKAHPDLFNILLQVMDYGTLTDNNGRKTDFRHVIIIMTTNAGAEFLERQPMGFTHQHQQIDSLQELNRLFSPEFRNRLDAIIQFNRLDEQIILKIVDKNLKELQEHLEAKQITLEVSNMAKQWLGHKGYSRSMGARPMERLIQEELKKPIAEELLFGQMPPGSHIEVTLQDGQLIINYLPPSRENLTSSNPSEEAA